MSLSYGGPQDAASAGNPPRLLDRLRQSLRTKHYSYRTEQAYVHWVRRFILFHHKRHPQEMGRGEIEQFLTFLAVERHVAASTQTQALCALLFLYNHVLRIKLPALDAVRAKRPKRLPVVLSRDEVRRLLEQVQGAHGAHRIMASLMYGSGLRLMECCRLRVKDLDVDRRQILVREAKGDKDRAVPFLAARRLRRGESVGSIVAQSDWRNGLENAKTPRRPKTCGVFEKNLAIPTFALVGDGQSAWKARAAVFGMGTGVSSPV
jgi:integrase